MNDLEKGLWRNLQPIMTNPDHPFVLVCSTTAEFIGLIGPPDLVEKFRQDFKDSLVPTEANRRPEQDSTLPDGSVFRAYEKVHYREEFMFRLVNGKFYRVPFPRET